MDQAAGLRARAAAASRPDRDAARRTLVVVGLPGGAAARTERVHALLAHWQAQGQRWVGAAADWRVVPLDPESPHLAALATQQARWGLWVGSDAEAFRRAFAVLGRLHERRGPRRLIAVHPPGLPRRGLLDNLRQAAASRLGIDLLVLAR